MYISANEESRVQVLTWSKIASYSVTVTESDTVDIESERSSGSPRGMLTKTSQTLRPFDSGTVNALG